LHLGVSGMAPKVPLRATIELSYFAARRASEANIIANGSSYELDPYVMLGASISTVGLELLPKKETVIMVIGRNLVGSTGPDPGFSGFDYPLTGRTILFQLRQLL